MNHSILSIARHGNLFDYEWRNPSRLSPAIVRWSVDVDSTLLRDLCSILIAEIETSGTDAGAESRLVVIGQKLFNVLIPATIEFKALRSSLAEVRDPLVLMIVGDDEVPWELLHDGTAFWGRRYDLGRGLVTGGGRAQKTELKHSSRRALLICDPDSTLPQSLQEGNALEVLLREQGFECRVLRRSDATRAAVTSALLEEYAVVHYAGHLDSGGSSGHLSLMLSDDAMPLQNLPRLIQGRPLVFLNGCSSQWALDRASRALEVNARAVVGSICKAMEAGGPEFAKRFYELLLEGEPIMESIRDARDRVSQDSRLGLAWAPYVLYTDEPLFTLGTADRIENELKLIGLRRDQFDVEAMKVLTRAFEWGNPNGVHPVHLFLAMQGGGDKTLRRWLRSRLSPGPGEKMEGVLERLIKRLLDSVRANRGAKRRFNSELQELLRVAGVTAGGHPISETHLLHAIVIKGVGDAGAVLSQFGLRLEELGSPNTNEAEGQAIGPVSHDECSTDGWDVLTRAKELTAKGGCTQVGSSQLLVALLATDSCSAGQNLARLGLRLDLDKLIRCSNRPTTFSARAPVTKGCGQVLTMAQANASAGSAPITAQCLLEAFVQSGGGNTGALLANAGLPIRILTTELIDDFGGLRESRVDAGVAEVFERAVAFSIRKGLGGVERGSLLYGLLSRPGGLLEKRIPEVAPSLTADLCVQYLDSHFSGKDATKALGTNWVSFTPNVRRILCIAEAYAMVRQSGEPVVLEDDLLRAIQEHGGGESAKLMLAIGVPFGKL